ncbi:hypothetical protein D3C72_1956220 [compost metagenome]
MPLARTRLGNISGSIVMPGTVCTTRPMLSTPSTVNSTTGVGEALSHRKPG